MDRIRFLLIAPQLSEIINSAFLKKMAQKKFGLWNLELERLMLLGDYPTKIYVKKFLKVINYILNANI